MIIKGREDIGINSWNRWFTKRRKIDIIQMQLAQAGIEAANYPFATIDPNVGVVEVPDERLNKLTELVKPKKNCIQQHLNLQILQVLYVEQVTEKG